MNSSLTESSWLKTLLMAVTLFLTLASFDKSQAAGLLKPVNGDDHAISIKSHDVTVVINNGFSKTEVIQVFTNSSAQDLEAVYSFPLPKQASLSELSLWINGQEVIGEVLEKKQARSVYEKQKAEGKQTAIAEKDDYKTFDVSVYPVTANGDTQVRLVYYQPLDIDLNVGRYVYPLEEGGVDEERIAFWSVDSAVQGTFTFDLTLKSAFPVKDVRFPGHSKYIQADEPSAINVGEGNNHSYHARIDLGPGASLSEDIVFYYRLDDTVPARVELIPFKESAAPQGTFMLTITPGASLAQIAEGTDWIFVLDKSGSMQGNKIQTLVNGVSKAIGKMSANDRFRIVTFNNVADDFSGGYLPATRENVDSSLEALGRLAAEGGTNMHAGLELGLAKIDEERTSAVILVTDGVANLGHTAHADFLKLLDNRDVRLFSIVIGNSANAPLLNDIASKSGGFSLDISNTDDIFGRILQVKSKMLYEALHDVELKMSGGGVKNLTPVSPGSLYRGQQLVVFGQYTKPGPAHLELNASISGQKQQWSSDIILPETDTDNPEIERLWALSAITEIMDDIRIYGEEDSKQQQVIKLGTEYSLVTDYTSMVVLNEQDMAEAGIQQNNAQRVHKERSAQQQRQVSPAKSYRADSGADGGMFKNAPSPGIGTGPVGPWLLLLLAACGILVRRKHGKA